MSEPTIRELLDALDGETKCHKIEGYAETLAERVEHVLRFHAREGNGCVACLSEYPCITVDLLNGNGEP